MHLSVFKPTQRVTQYFAIENAQKNITQFSSLAPSFAQNQFFQGFFSTVWNICSIAVTRLCMFLHTKYIKLKQNHCKLKPKIFKSILFSLNDYVKTSKWRNIVCCLKDDFYECNLTHFACYNFHMAITFYWLVKNCSFLWSHCAQVSNF